MIVTQTYHNLRSGILDRSRRADIVRCTDACTFRLHHARIVLNLTHGLSSTPLFLGRRAAVR